MIATGSMDNTAKLWDVETGKEKFTLMGHTAEIVSLNFNSTGDQIITGSFDHTVKVWDVKSGKYGTLLALLVSLVPPSSPPLVFRSLSLSVALSPLLNSHTATATATVAGACTR